MTIETFIFLRSRLGLHRDKAPIMLAGPVLFAGETGGYA